MAAEQRKAYIVTDGAYSDYHICQVFDSEKAAQDYKEMRRRLDECFIGDIEVWTLNAEPVIAPIVYRVYIDREGQEVERNTHLDWNGWNNGDEVFVSSHVSDYAVGAESTRGYDVALKIARDKLAEMKAKEAGV